MATVSATHHLFSQGSLRREHTGISIFCQQLLTMHFSLTRFLWANKCILHSNTDTHSLRPPKNDAAGMRLHIIIMFSFCKLSAITAALLEGSHTFSCYSYASLILCRFHELEPSIRCKI